VIVDGLSFLTSIKKMPFMPLTVRTSVISLPNAKILFAPGSGLTKAQLKEAGDITDIVAPNLLHCAGIPPAIEVFPKAKVWGPPGARTAKPEIAWTNELNEASWPYEEGLKLITLNGMPKVNEVVFVHPPSKSLLVTDMFFNITHPKGIGAWLILNMFGTYKRFAMSKFFAKFVQDKEAFTKSLKKIMANDFENVIVSHGDIHRGKALVEKAINERGFAIH
jgi:hypothetical protein